MTINQRILDILARQDPGCFLRLVFSDVDDPLELDYVSLLREATRWLDAYQAAGVPRSGRVVIVLPHSADLYAAFLGALLSRRVPAILAPPSPKLSSGDFEAMAQALLARLEADVVVADDKLAATIATMARRPVLTPSQVVFDSFPANLNIDLDGGDDDIAFIQYSSGTTGAKKGTAISQRAIIAQADMYARAIGLGGADSIVSWLPLYHDMGLIACFLLPLLTGTPVTAMSAFEWIGRPGMLLDVVQRHRSTMMWLPNFAYHVVSRAASAADASRWDLSSLRAVINCSEPVRHGSHAALAEALAPFGFKAGTLKTCYAMAEATFAVTSGGFPSPPLELEVDPGDLGRDAMVRPGAHILVSSGAPLAGVEVMIGAPEAPLPAGRIGEIWVRSPSLFSGYLGDPAATAAALRQDLLRTGDIGFMVQGELFVLGRADDMIIVAGRNYHPQDIEAVVDGVDGVVPGRSVAFGVELASEGTSQLVVVSESEIPDETSRLRLAGQIRRSIGARLDVVPRDVRVVEPRWLRKSTSGKLSRAANRSAYLDRFGSPDRVAPASSPIAEGGRRDTVRRIVAEVLQGRSVDDDDPLLTSGLIDSLGLAQLCAALEERYGRHVPSPNLTGFARFDSIAAIDALLADVQSGGRYGARESAVSTRLHKCRNLEQGGRDQDLLILGSSTAHFARTRVAAELGYRAFNFSVGSADPVDFYCQLRFALERLKLPLRRIVICLDSFLLKIREGMPFKERLLEVPDLIDYLMEEEREALPQGDAARSVWSDVKLTLRRMMEWSPDFASSFDPRNGDMINLDRPLADQDRPYRLADARQRHAEMETTFNTYDRLCPRRVAYYEATAKLAREHGIAVDHVVMPFHGELARHMDARTSYSKRMEEILRMLAEVGRNRQAIHDFRTIERFAGDPDDFTDPTHPGPVNMIAMLRRVLAADG